MKNKITLNLLILAVLSISSISLSAQDKNDKPAKIGVRAGWNYASMFIDNEELSGAEHINSFYIGVFKEKKMVPLLRLGSGLEYFQNGYKVTDNITREIHYISVPLYLKLKIGPVYATGGTGFNFKVSEEIPGSALADPLNNEKTQFFDMPFQLGAGLKILMFSVEARYNWGMFNVHKEASNQYMQLGFTVSF
ncbi:outer membrane beta-barrel protein [Carboxylicivirga sp. N1Y90]|uniref:outer membrane beta-barrel protein n=1 Tax=Carboxylicivirga fragile TaxID=3417571 RepID=UPI003D3522FA|nr:PorT family protein [Marinilabiliaceae bacterium N1Y90]